MILFLGDSFTWGQGLYYRRWIKDGLSSDDINKKLPPYTFHENIISYEDDNYRKNHHFPALVSKHFNKPYSTKYGNGGSNRNIINILKNIRHQMMFETIELIIVQFTFWSRDIENPSLVKKLQKKYNINEIEAMFMIREKQIETVVDLCKRPKEYQKFHSTDNEIKIQSSSYNKEIPVRFLCEEPEWGDYIHSRYPDLLLTINYDNKLFKNLSDWKTYNNSLSYITDGFNMPGKQKILLCDEFEGVEDYHYSEHGHQIIADSLKHHLSSIF